MVEVIDDTVQFTVSAVAGAEAKIENVVAPDTVIVGQPFDVTYDVRNIGGITGSFFGRIEIPDQGVIPGSEWTQDLDSDGVKHVTHTFADGIIEDLTAVIIAGHINE